MRLGDYRYPMKWTGATGLMDHIGKRLTIRLHEASGGYRDIVGILESPSTLRHKDGREITFSQNEIAIYREIIPLSESAGKGAPLSIRIIELEKLLNSTWSATEQFMHGQWLFRASGKYTMRANSVLPQGAPPFGKPEKEINEAIKDVITFYSERDLEPIFHLPLPLYEELFNYLIAHGWREKLRAQVQVIDIPVSEIDSDLVLEVSATCNSEWLLVQGDEKLLDIMDKTQALYYILKKQDTAVAVLRAGISDDWAVISRLFVKPEYRGNKFSQELMHLVFRDLRSAGITKAALQVDLSNEAAMALYKGLGFRKHHEYSYVIQSSES
jgi:GNAT superfamily N-acetyltransferase